MPPKVPRKINSITTPQGFTLIELVVVIVILGILAVTAAPRYINLKADAQTSTLHGVQAAMQGAAALVYAKSLVKGNHKEPFLFSTTGTGNTVNIGDGVGFTADGELFIAYGYPIGSKDEFKRLVPLDPAYEYLQLGTSIDTLVVYFKNNEPPTSINDDCIAVYVMPTGVGQSPTFKVNDCI